MCEGQRAIFWSSFSPFITWVLGIKFRLLRFGNKHILSTEPSYQPLSVSRKQVFFFLSLCCLSLTYTVNSASDFWTPKASRNQTPCLARVLARLLSYPRVPVSSCFSLSLIPSSHSRGRQLLSYKNKSDGPLLLLQVSLSWESKSVSDTSSLSVSKDGNWVLRPLQLGERYWWIVKVGGKDWRTKALVSYSHIWHNNHHYKSSANLHNILTLC